jgi:nucleotide-binding universal stress UspA family protein
LLHFIHALDFGIYALGSAPAAAVPYLANSSAIALEGLDELRTAADVRLGDTLQQFGVEGHTSIVSGHAASAIVSYAETVGAEVIVVGTHGRSGFARMTLGSTAAGVIDSAPCSVLVVRVVGK